MPFCNKFHRFDDCPQEDDVQCYHCKQDHFTGQRNCEFYKHAAKIEDLKQKGEITYEESKKRYNSLNNKILDDLLNNINEEDKTGGKNEVFKNDRNLTVGSGESSQSLNNFKGTNNIQANILTQNRFGILEEEIEEESDDEDFFDFPNFINQGKKSKPKKKENVDKGYSKTYAKVVQSSLNQPTKENEKIVQSKTFYNNHLLQTTQNNSSSSSSKESNKTQDNETRKINFESFTQDFKEFFFYQILDKIKNLTLRTPIHSVDFWFNFIFDLFVFVGQQFENIE